MNIGIIAAMDLELQDILANLDSKNKRTETFHGRQVTIVDLNHHHLYLGVCGIGKVNAATFAQYLLDKFSVDILINTGIAGSLAESLGTLSVVLATELVYHDFERDIQERTYPYIHAFPTDKQLREMAKAALPEGTKVTEGIIASGDAFIQDEKKKLAIAEDTEAIAVDMESAAIAHVAAGARKPCLIMRVISDAADESYKDLKYVEFEAKAAKLSAQMMLAILQQL